MFKFLKKRKLEKEKRIFLLKLGLPYWEDIRTVDFLIERWIKYEKVIFLDVVEDPKNPNNAVYFFLKNSIFNKKDADDGHFKMGLISYYKSFLEGK